MDSRVILKKCVALLSSTILLSATVVVAAEPRLIRSKGQYAINSDNGSIVVDANDIEANAEAIASLEQQLGGLSFKYGTEKEVGVSDKDDKDYYWSQNDNGDWIKIGAVGSARPTDVLEGVKFSSEQGVDIDGEMPVPTTIKVEASQNPSDNQSISGSAISVSNSTDTQAPHDTDTTEIAVGVGQKIIIPHGYYNKDIVITNGVSDKGSAPVYLSASNKTVTLPAGYYGSFTVTTDVTAGGGTIYYRHHVHSQSSTKEYFENQSPAITSEGPADTERVATSSGCFTKPVYGTKVCGSDYATSKLVHEDREGHYDVTWRCGSCGANYRKSGRDISSGWRCSNSVTDYSKIIGYTTGCGIPRGTMTEAVIKY